MIILSDRRLQTLLVYGNSYTGEGGKRGEEGERGRKKGEEAKREGGGKKKRRRARKGKLRRPAIVTSPYRFFLTTI